jgi:hypothetical protein
LPSSGGSADAYVWFTSIDETNSIWTKRAILMESKKAFGLLREPTHEDLLMIDKLKKVANDIPFHSMSVDGTKTVFARHGSPTRNGLTLLRQKKRGYSPLLPSLLLAVLSESFSLPRVSTVYAEKEIFTLSLGTSIEPHRRQESSRNRMGYPFKWVVSSVTFGLLLLFTQGMIE